MSGERIGVGVVGMGTIGRRHAEALAQLTDDVRVVAGSGGTADALAETGHPQAHHLAPEEVIHHPDIDLVALCTPSGLHGAQALEALKGGKHVVVEKPLSVEVEPAEEIVRVAEERTRLVSVISQRRLESTSRYLKQLLEAGRLGVPVLGEAFVHWLRDDAYYAHAAWRTRQDQGGGSLMNQGLHSVDLLAWLMGPVTRVTAEYATLGREMDAEDTTVATLRFVSGALGLVATSTATPPGRAATMAVFTSEGSAELANRDVVRWDFGDVPAPAQAEEAAGGGGSDPRGIGLAGHLAQWRDTIDAYRSGRPPAVTARDGLATVRLLNGIYRACETGRAVQLNGTS